MKKYFVFLFVAAVVFTQLALSACGKSFSESDKKINDYIDATEYHDSGKRVDCFAKVNDVGKYTVSVTVEGSDGSEMVVCISGGTELLGKNDEKLTVSDLMIGMRIVITSDGTVIESDPPRILRCYCIRVID